MYSTRALPQAISHRGLHSSLPENSIPAFQAALDAGADGIELDVHATLDGTVVVHHDFDVVLDGENVPLRSLDAHSLARVTLDDRTHIPTLDQMLEAVLDKARVYIEVKAPGMEADVVRCLKRHAHFVENHAVHSFDHRIVKRILELMPSVRTGILQVGYPVDSIAAMRAAGAMDLWQHVDFVDERLVADVHARQGRIIAWTANSTTGWSHLADAGVDGICTDRVDEYVAWRSSRTPSDDSAQR